MTHVIFLLHRLLFSETHTDRQDKFVIDAYLRGFPLIRPHVNTTS